MEKKGIYIRRGGKLFRCTKGNHIDSEQKEVKGCFLRRVKFTLSATVTSGDFFLNAIFLKLLKQ
jgi:hypothetical protein